MSHTSGRMGLSLGLLLALSASAFVQASDGTPASKLPQDAGKSTSFYVRKAEGWFWYERMPDWLKPQKRAQPPARGQTPPAPVPGQTAAPAVFSAAWFRQNLPRYKDLAWDHPTLENLKAFLLVQRLSIERSQRFAEVAELATLGDPWLDEIARRPIATFAAQTMDQKSGQQQAALLKTLAQRAGLLFFFRSDCAVCAVQAPLIQALAQNHGFAVLPVSLDGHALPGNPLPNVRPDHGQAEKLGVQIVPALYLASRDGQFSAVGQGAMSSPELQHRILVAALRAEWITEAEFDQARPVQSILVDRTRVYPNGAPFPTPEHPSQEPTGFIPPAQLVEAFKVDSSDGGTP